MLYKVYPQIITSVLSIENSWKITGNEIIPCGAFSKRD